MTPIIHSKRSFYDLLPQDKIFIGDFPYIIDRQMRGGMACVYILSRDSKITPKRLSALGYKIVLKAILPDVAETFGVELFKRELAVWSGFRHENIVWLLEIIDGGDAGWVAAMDWCIGSLRDIQEEKGKLSIIESTNIINNILDGLSYAYTKDRVHHLDVKPENILYNLDCFGKHQKNNEDDNNSLSKYRFMLSDWGIASIKQPQLNAIVGKPPSSAEVKRTLNNMGTLFYMAPERFNDGYSSSIASDVFSLGMIYLELLVGCLPFRNEIHPIHSLTSGQYYIDAQTLLNSNRIPVSVSNIILKMIAYYPTQRPQDFSELHSDIVRAWRKSNGIFHKLFN